MATNHLFIKMFGDELTDRSPDGTRVSYNLPMETVQVKIADEIKLPETDAIKFIGDEVSNRELGSAKKKI